MTKNNSAIVIVIVVLAAFCLLVSCVGGGAVVGWLYFSRSAANSREEAARMKIRNLGAAVEVYVIRHGQPPQNLQQLVVADRIGGPILKYAHDLIDPWGNPYQYDAAGPRNNGERPDIWTNAPDGRVIGNWDKASSKRK